MAKRPQIKNGKVVQSENSVHLQVVKIIRLKWPTILFRTDFAAGLKMEPRLAARHSTLQKGKSWPDLFVCHPAGKYHGLFLELKKDVSDVYLADRVTLVAKDHIRDQDRLLKHLRALGFQAHFAFGTDHAIELLENYLSSGS